MYIGGGFVCLADTKKLLGGQLELIQRILNFLKSKIYLNLTVFKGYKLVSTSVCSMAKYNTQKKRWLDPCGTKKGRNLIKMNPLTCAASTGDTERGRGRCYVTLNDARTHCVVLHSQELYFVSSTKCLLLEYPQWGNCWQAYLEHNSYSMSLRKTQMHKASLFLLHRKTQTVPTHTLSFYKSLILLLEFPHKRKVLKHQQCTLRTKPKSNLASMKEKGRTSGWEGEWAFI